jgi:hypothetical protein
MQITAIGTIWRCQENPNHEEDDTGRYQVYLAEHLPGNVDKNGNSRGQAVKFSLECAEPLEEGIPYSVTALVIGIGPTHEDDDIEVYGVLMDAKQIE